MAKPEWYATKKLKELREQSGYTQEQMADYMGLALGKPVSLSLYQKWEQGIKKLSPDQVLELAKKFTINYMEIVEKK